MPSIPENFIDDLIARVDLRDLLGRYISLKKAGSRYVGVCPFHGDTNPSLSVNPDKGFWYCFGCQTGGDAITFIRKQENMDFVEAVKFIAQLYGIPVPESASDPHASRRRTLIDINDRTREFFVKVLKSKHGRPFRDYLTERGFKKEAVLAYRIGASLPGWENLAKRLLKDGFTEKDLIDAGVALPRKNGGIYDRFRGRLMIPIVDTLDRTLGFGARAMGDDEPKYINSPESPIFLKSKTLFGLDLAKKACRDSGQLIIMEGYTDVIQAHQAGVENCCAVMGTALTSEHLPLLARFAGDVVLAFDGDEAGIRATTRSVMEFAGSDFLVRVLPLPKGRDPADIIKSEGADKFRERLESAISASKWLFKTYGEPVRNKAISVRLKQFEDIAQYLAKYKSHPIFEELQEQAAIAFDLNLSVIRSALIRVKQGAGAARKELTAQGLESQIKDRIEVERVLFLSLMADPHYLPEVLEILDPDDFDHPIHRQLARIFFQPGFSLGTADGLKRIREINDDEELYSYVVRLNIEHEEDRVLGDNARYTDKELKSSLLIMVRRQYETESKRLQACMADLKSEEGIMSDATQSKLLELMQERKDLDKNYRILCSNLGGDVYEVPDDSEVVD